MKTANYLTYTQTNRLILFLIKYSSKPFVGMMNSVAAAERNNVKVIAHPGSTTKDMLDYINSTEKT